MATEGGLASNSREHTREVEEFLQGTDREVTRLAPLVRAYKNPDTGEGGWYAALTAMFGLKNRSSLTRVVKRTGWNFPDNKDDLPYRTPPVE